MALLFASVIFFVYLCNRKGYETRTTMQTDVKHQPNDAPITTDAIGTGNVMDESKEYDRVFGRMGSVV